MSARANASSDSNASSSSSSSSSSSVANNRRDAFLSGPKISQTAFFSEKDWKKNPKAFEIGACASISALWIAKHVLSQKEARTDNADWRYGQIKAMGVKPQVDLMNDIHGAASNSDQSEIVADWIACECRSSLPVTGNYKNGQSRMVTREILCGPSSSVDQINSALRQPGYSIVRMQIEYKGNLIAHWLAFHTTQDSSNVGAFNVRMMDPNEGEFVKSTNSPNDLIDFSLEILSMKAMQIDTIYLGNLDSNQGAEVVRMGGGVRSPVNAPSNNNLSSSSASSSSSSSSSSSTPQ